MNKKESMAFNLNNFLLAISFVLDCIKKNSCNTSLHHSKRVAYLSLKIGQKFNLSDEQLFDLCAYALFHSNALYYHHNDLKDYCKVAQKNTNILPFLTQEKEVLLYAKEYYDGSGVFGLKADEIPLFSQIIAFSELLDTQFDLSSCDTVKREVICTFIKNNESKLFSVDMSEIFCDELAIHTHFWLDLEFENQLLTFIFDTLTDFTVVLPFEEILRMTTLFTKMNDGNSDIINKADVIARFYSFDHKDTQTFLIAASLCTLGKLCIPSCILKKKDTLTQPEYECIKAYPYYTKHVLDNIMGFKDISSWASSVQEKNDGSGYPYGLSSKDLSLKQRLLAVLIIYESLRKRYEHEKSIDMMMNMARKKHIDESIVKDFDEIFA